MIKLGVNIDHTATIRQARFTKYPDICEVAKLSIEGGADQITIHLREDRRHIQDKDLFDLKKTVTVPLNLEMACVDSITEIALKVCPERVTLVPEKREELTTEGGLDVLKFEKEISKCIKALRSANIAVSLFIEPEHEQIVASKRAGADMVEFHTGRFCDLTGEKQSRELDRLVTASKFAKTSGLVVAMGHGLNYENVLALCNVIPEIEELNIGHSIVARAIIVGMKKAVEEMKKLIHKSGGNQ